MKMTVMSGTGNLFAVFDAFAQGLPANAPELARRSCRSHNPGLDGLLVVAPSESADCRMVIYNADGSRPESCGNGLRCVARMAVERGHVSGDALGIETDCGVRRARALRDSTGKITGATVAMGPARILAPTERIRASWGDIDVTRVDVGNPHCVVFVEDPSATPVDRWGPELEHYAPRGGDWKGTNVEFVAVGEDHLRMRVWERGVGETAACGTGACAAALAAESRGLVELPIEVALIGGSLYIARDGFGEVTQSGACEPIGALEGTFVSAGS
jgi:diaminopimelate epimerase